MSVRLYDLVLADGAPFSPYVWRVKYALAHKNLAVETVPVGFRDIPRLFGESQRTVPVLEDQGRMIGDSWRIIDHLEAEHPDRPLFSTAAERALVRFFDAWFIPNVNSAAFAMMAHDIHAQIRAEDQPYFRETREKRLGAPLESLVAARPARTAAFRASLQPLRATLAETPYLGGATPNVADYIGWSTFRWIGAVAREPALAGEDSLRPWIERGFAWGGGLGAPAPRHALFA